MDGIFIMKDIEMLLMVIVVFGIFYLVFSRFFFRYTYARILVGYEDQDCLKMIKLNYNDRFHHIRVNTMKGNAEELIGLVWEKKISIAVVNDQCGDLSGLQCLTVQFNGKTRYIIYNPEKKSKGKDWIIYKLTKEYCSLKHAYCDYMN